MHFSSVQQFFELRITILLDFVGNDREFHQNSLDTSLPRVVGRKMLFLCLGFAVPSTVGSLLLNDVVRDGESIQSPLTNNLTGFAFNQEMSTGAIDHSDSNKEGILRMDSWNCFAKLEELYIAPFHESSLSNRQ